MPAADHAIIWELGFTGEWEREEGALHSGGTVAFEVTPIEHWLEVEVGIAALRADRGWEVPIDVLVKKPWQITPTFEFMAGVGPELVHATGPDKGTFWGVALVADFMVWPRKNVGWYVEPGYETTFRDHRTHGGVAIAAGVLLGR
jgi:hypothetical protein